MLDLVRIQGVSKTFAEGKRRIHALKAINLNVREGECLALVGESGCGKSTLARILSGLEAPTAGEATIGGLSVQSLESTVHQRRARLCQMVFQDPFASLNPRLRVDAIIEEPLIIHAAGDSQRRKRRVLQLLHTVGLSDDHARNYPHQLSGGQRQRVAIARALALSPKLLIADEPVSALDVSIQAQILNLLHDLREQLGLTLLLVSHDLEVVRWMSDRIVVMYRGRIVETGDTAAVIERPAHPYTRLLLGAAPRLGAPLLEVGYPALGGAPDHMDGCAFFARCAMAQPHCSAAEPVLDGREHRVACFEAPNIG